jgi:hypothetical protein
MSTCDRHLEGVGGMELRLSLTTIMKGDQPRVLQGRGRVQGANGLEVDKSIPFDLRRDFPPVNAQRDECQARVASGMVPH